MQNENWEEFKTRIFGSAYMIWHDGVPDCHFELQREDPSHVQAMILEGLDSEDYVALEALKQISNPADIHDLRERLAKTYGKFKIELAAYLQKKDPDAKDGRYSQVLIDEIKFPTWIMRMDTAILLREFPANEVTETLLTCVAKDVDYLVRYHSAESFLKVNGLKPEEISAYPEIFKQLVEEKNPQAHEEAAQMLKALINPDKIDKKRA